jgi:argininosuccinate lyase
MKALPLAYNKDMQEDKEPLFDTVDSIMLCVQAMSGMVLDFTANEKKMRAAAEEGYSTATDLADWLVKKLSMPFRDAHHVAAKVVKCAAGKSKTLSELSLKELQTIEPKITADAMQRLSVEASVASRTSFGGTSPANVKKAIQSARKRFSL